MPIPRIIAHPVMGTYIIVLLAIMTISLPLGWFVSMNLATCFSTFGTVLATTWLAGCAILDSRRKR